MRPPEAQPTGDASLHRDEALQLLEPVLDDDDPRRG